MPGDCHYQLGNVNARRRVNFVRKLLSEIGLESERVQMFNMSAAMAGEFARVAQEMAEKIGELGRNPLRKDEG